MVYRFDLCSFLHTDTSLSFPMASRSAKTKQNERQVRRDNYDCCVNEQERRGKIRFPANHLKTAHKGFVDAHHSASIVELAAIVRRGEQCNELSFGEKFVTVLDDLMRSAYQIHVVTIQELRHNIWTECKRYSSVVLAPTLSKNASNYDKRTLILFN